MQGDLNFNILREACPFNGDGLELLGLKWLPSINTSQAKEMTPYEVSIVVIITNNSYPPLDEQTNSQCVVLFTGRTDWLERKYQDVNRQTSVGVCI